MSNKRFKFNAQRAGCYIVSVQNHGADNTPASRKSVSIVSGVGVLSVGTVLGVRASDNVYVPVDVSAKDGSELAVAILFDEVDTTLDVDAPSKRVAVDRGKIVVNGEYLVVYGNLSVADVSAITDSLEVSGVVVRNPTKVTPLEPNPNVVITPPQPFTFVKLVSKASEAYVGIRDISFKAGEVIQSLNVLTPYTIVAKKKLTAIYDNNMFTYGLFDAGDGNSIKGQTVEMVMQVTNPNNTLSPSFQIKYITDAHIPETLEVLVSSDGVTFESVIPETPKSAFNIQTGSIVVIPFPAA